jgi:hypothetical protein
MLDIADGSVMTAPKLFGTIVLAGLVLIAAYVLLVNTAGVTTSAPTRTTVVQHKRDPSPPVATTHPCFNVNGDPGPVYLPVGTPCPSIFQSP